MAIQVGDTVQTGAGGSVMVVVAINGSTVTCGGPSGERNYDIHLLQPVTTGLAPQTQYAKPVSPVGRAVAR